MAVDKQMIARALMGIGSAPPMPTVPRPMTPPTGLGNMQTAQTFGPDPSKPASWVIVEKGTGKAVMETFDGSILPKLNTNKYEAVPIQIYLGSLNKRG